MIKRYKIPPATSFPALLFRESKVLMRRRASSRLRTVCASLHVGDRQVRLAGGSSPSSKTSSIVTFSKKAVSDRDYEPGRKWSSFRAWAASKSMFVVLTAYTDSLGYDRYVNGWILKLFLPDWSSKYRQTDPRKSAKNVRFQENAPRRVLLRVGNWEAGFGLLVVAAWFRQSWQQRTITKFRDLSSQKHVGWRRRHTHTADKVLTPGQTLLFYRYRFTFVQQKQCRVPSSVYVHVHSFRIYT